MLKIGKRWTDKDRMSVILKIASEMTLGGYELSGNKLLDIQDRIVYAITMDKDFLEANRDKIINGNSNIN